MIPLRKLLWCCEAQLCWRDVLLCCCLASGALMALSWWMAGSHLHWAGEGVHRRNNLILRKWHCVTFPEKAGGRPLCIQRKCPSVAGRQVSDEDARGLCRRSGCHLYDSQSPERRDPGLLHVLFLSDATWVRLTSNSDVSSQSAQTVYSN